MTSGGYSIGFKELYDLVTEVSRKLDSTISLHGQQIAACSDRIETMGKGMKMLWTTVEKTKGSGWQVNLAMGTSAVSLLTALATVLVK